MSITKIQQSSSQQANISGEGSHEDTAVQSAASSCLENLAKPEWAGPLEKERVLQVEKPSESKQTTILIALAKHETGENLKNCCDIIKNKLLNFENLEEAFNFVSELSTLLKRSNSTDFRKAGEAFYKLLIQKFVDTASFEKAMSYAAERFSFQIDTEFGYKSYGQDILFLIFNKMLNGKISFDHFFEILPTLDNEKSALKILSHICSVVDNGFQNYFHFSCEIAKRTLICKSQIKNNNNFPDLNKSIKTSIRCIISKLSIHYTNQKLHAFTLQKDLILAQINQLPHGGYQIVDTLLELNEISESVKMVKKIIAIETKIEETPNEKLRRHIYILKISAKLNLETALETLADFSQVMPSNDISRLTSKIIANTIRDGYLESAIAYAAKIDQGIGNELVIKNPLACNLAMRFICKKILIEKNNFDHFLDLISKLNNKLLILRVLCYICSKLKDQDIDTTWLVNYVIPKILICEEKMGKPSTKEELGLQHLIERFLSAYLPDDTLQTSGVSSQVVGDQDS